MTYTIVPPTDEHIQWIAEHLRDSDRMELEATCGTESILDRLRLSVEVSGALSFVALYDQKPCAVFGAGPILGRSFVGGAWLVGTDDLGAKPREAMDLSYDWLALLHLKYPVLFNWVDARNEVSQRWLKRLGFQTGEVIDVGGHPFILHWRVRDV